MNKRKDKIVAGTVLPENLIIQIPSRWPSNLKRAVITLAESPGLGSVRKEVRETPSLRGHAAIVSFCSHGSAPPSSRTALSGGRDAYEWSLIDGSFVIRGANPRSAAFAIFEILRRLGLRWLTWMREPWYLSSLAEPISGRYQWRAAFSVTSASVWLSSPQQNAEGISQLDRHCRWLLFHHWNTLWYPYVTMSPALGDMVHSFGLEYEVGGHDLKQAMPRRYFAEHSDFFPFVRGRRTADMGDFALTNPEAQQVVRREAEAIFRRHRGAEGMHFWYDDVWRGAEDEAVPSGWSPTRRAAEGLRLVSPIHHRIASGQRLITLAYNAQIIPDRAARFDPHIKVLFCPRERCQVHPLDGCRCNRAYLQLLKRWVDLLGPERIFFLDYSLDHYLAVSTWRVHPAAEVLAADLQTLAKMGLGGLHTLNFPDFSDVEAAGIASSLAQIAARPFTADFGRLGTEYFQIAFGPYADMAAKLLALYTPVQAAFLHYDDYLGRKRDMRFAGLDQTQPSLRHARLLNSTLKTHGRKLNQALQAAAKPSLDTSFGRELYRMIQNLHFSLREFSLAAAMLEGVPYLRGENATPVGRKAWLRARAELAALKPDVQAWHADPIAAGAWSRDWLGYWSAQMGRCLQFGQVEERD